MLSGCGMNSILRMSYLEKQALGILQQYKQSEDKLDELKDRYSEWVLRREFIKLNKDCWNRRI